MVEIARKIGGEDGAEACGKVIDNCGIIALPVKIFLFIVALLTSILLFPLTAPAEAIGRALNAHDEKTEGLKKQYLDALIQLTLVSKDIPIEPCFNKEDQTQAINYLCSILPGVIRDESHPLHRLSLVFTGNRDCFNSVISKFHPLIIWALADETLDNDQIQLINSMFKLPHASFENRREHYDRRFTSRGTTDTDVDSGYASAEEEPRPVTRPVTRPVRRTRIRASKPTDKRTPYPVYRYQTRPDGSTPPPPPHASTQQQHIAPSAPAMPVGQPEVPQQTFDVIQALSHGIRLNVLDQPEARQENLRQCQEIFRQEAVQSHIVSVLQKLQYERPDLTNQIALGEISGPYFAQICGLQPLPPETVPMAGVSHGGYGPYPLFGQPIHHGYYPLHL